jgi:photosynthetic reaction center H subunit
MTIPIRPVTYHPGSAFEPTGDAMKDGVGAASYAADRADRPDLTHDGLNRIQPMRMLSGWSVESRDPDPRGMRVVGDDRVSAGEVTDLWVDLAEPAIRFLEVELDEGAGTVLVPMGFVKVFRREGEVRVQALYGKHFADIPRIRAEDRITLLEEDRLYGYFMGGYRYADPSRLDPIV